MSAEPDYLPADALAEDEPKFLRRQKPVEIRKRNFSRKVWPLYRRVLAAGILGISAPLALFAAVNYFLRSSAVSLRSAGQIEIQGSRYVPPGAIAEKFSADMEQSIVRVPLDERRKAVESIPWVEQAAVQRVFPDRIRVEIRERRPVAFLRGSPDLSLVDSHGVILERPADAEFHFPVVAGLGESMPPEERERRMNLYTQFTNEIELAAPGASDHVSEADLSDAADVRAVLTGLGSKPVKAPPVLVHFGDSDFANRYRLLTQNIDQWRASAGNIDSVDLRFARQVVVNPEARPMARPVAASVKQQAPPRTQHRVKIARKRR